MTRVLITGASGFIGRHLVRHLSENGYQVDCLMRKRSDPSGIRDFKPRMILGDITDPDSLNGAIRGQDLVVNLAGRTRAFAARKLYQVNEQGARNVAAACARQTNPPVLVQISSLAIAGPAKPHRPVTVNDHPNPVSAYGRSKLAGERAVLEFANRLPLSILRPPIVFGEGDRDVFQLFQSIMNWGVAFTPPFADRVYSMIHAADLCAAIRLIGEQGQRVVSATDCGIYYAAAEDSPSFNELARMIGQIMNRDPVRVVQCSQMLTSIAGLACEAIGQALRRPMLINLDKTREALAGAWNCDTRMVKELGFVTPPLWSRLRQTAEWYMRQGWLRDRLQPRYGTARSVSMAAEASEKNL